MLSLTNFAAEMEREKARQRTYDAMLRKAKALHVTGGKVYGYDNVDVLAPADLWDRVGDSGHQLTRLSMISEPHIRIPSPLRDRGT